MKMKIWKDMKRYEKIFFYVDRYTKRLPSKSLALLGCLSDVGVSSDMSFIDVS